jgi:hypothetical protein
MSDIAKFLARVVPWPTATLPGFVSVHWPSKKPDPKSDGMPGRAFQQAQSAVGFTNGMLRNPVDLYLCMSLQSQSWPPRIKNGREQRGAMRRALNAVALRCFYLDVDIKDGKFRDTTHALTVFGEWRRKIGLPLPSLLVFTGSGGFHVYWVLHEPIPLATWQPVAEALKVACQQHGFEPDHKITADAARVLRIPGTFNQKHQPPRLAEIAHEGPDYTLADIETPLTPYKVRPGVTRQIPSKFGGISPVFAGVLPTGRLDAGLDAYQPELEDVINGGCLWLDALKQTGGAGRGENEWFESLKVAYYLKDNLQVAHELSEDHATYSEQDTDAKFAAIEHSHGNGRIGWPQCRSIHDAGAGECRSCDHFNKGRSPLNFAKPIVAIATAAAIAFSPVPSAAMPTHPEWLPFPYQHDKEKRVYREVVDPKDENKLERQYVLPLPIYNLALYNPGPEGGKFLIGFDCAVRDDIIPRVAASYAQIMDTRKLSEHFGEVGLLAKPAQVQQVREFMTAFVHQLRDAKERITVYNNAPFGWFKAKGVVDGFVYNRKLFNGKDPLPIHPLSPAADAKYTPSGNLAAWKSVAKLITDQQRPELIVPICASIGSPLLKITGLRGAVLHLWGDSGSGKSNSLRLAQSVWGGPDAMATLQDTANSIDVLLQMLHNLPAIYDEMSNSIDRKLVDLFMRISQGQGKKRSRRDGQDINETRRWQTMLISAANVSMHAYISDFDTTNVAAMNRVFEYRVLQNTSRKGMLELGSEAERMFATLDDNYGVAGLEIAKFLGANHDPVEHLVKTLTAATERRVQGTPDDRFYAPVVSVILAGGVIGKKLGLIDANMDSVEGFLIEQLQEQRLQRTGSTSNLRSRDNVERLIAEFVADSRDRMIRTRDLWITTNRPPAGWSAVTLSTPSRDGKVVVRVATSSKIIRLSVTAFNAWLRKERHTTFGEVWPAIHDAMPNARTSKWDLGHGVGGWEQGRILALEIVDPQFWDFN